MRFQDCLKFSRSKIFQRTICQPSEEQMKHLLVDYKLVFDLKLRPNFCDFMQTSDPVGAIVLERCQVLKDSPTQKKHGFTIGKLFLPL